MNFTLEKRCCELMMICRPIHDAIRRVPACFVFFPVIFLCIVLGRWLLHYRIAPSFELSTTTQ